MAAETQLLQDLAVVIGAAAVTAVVFRRLQLPLVFGFLVAGVVIGPNTPPFSLVSDEQSIQTLANLGVVLLLFGLGLDFNFRSLRRVGAVAFVVMATEVLLMLWLGFELGLLLGWSPLDSVFLGATISISSTAIIVKVLRDLGRLDRESSQIVFGVLVLEDIVAILMLVILSGYAATGDLALASVGRVLAQMFVFLLGTLIVGLLVVPRLVDYVARSHGTELLVLTVVGLAFGFAILSHLAKFHVGLGAFLIGVIIAESRERNLVKQQLRPVHDIFAAIFFVSIGTLVDFSALQSYWRPVLIVFSLIVLGKLVSGTLATFLVGYPAATAISVGAALASMGEFSFVIATLGLETGVTSEFLFPVIVGAAALTSLTAPLAIRFDFLALRALRRLSPAPFLTYARIYTTWMTSIRLRAGPVQKARAIHARRRVLVDAMVLLTMIGASWVLQAPGQALLRSQGIAEPANALTYWGVSMAAMIPILFLLFQAVNRWITTWEPPDAAARRTGLGFRRSVQWTVYFLGAILLGLPVLVVTAPIFRSPFIVLVWMGMVGSAAVILWATITRLHGRIEENLQSLLDDRRVPAHAPQVVRDLLTVDIPWELEVESFDVAPGTWAIGKRLGELDLRSATGASLILIERGNQREETPGPDTILFPGDRLTLIGSKEQLASARAVLMRAAPTGQRRGELRIGRLYVSESSALDGVRLADAALPTRSGLQVVAIQREERVIANPGAQEKLQPGDIVLVLGLQDQIASAMELVGPRSETPAPTESAPT